MILRAAWKLRCNLPPLSVMPLFLLGSLLIFPLTFADILPRIDLAWPSRQVARMLEDQPAGKLISVGFGEPSLAFLNDTETRMTNARGAVPLLSDESFRYLLLEGRQKQRLVALAPGQLDKLQLLQAFESYNYSKGKRLKLELYAKP